MESSELIKLLREARKIEVKVGHITFTGSCPTYSKLLKIISTAADDSADARIAALAITGWSGVTEFDVIGGSEDVPIEFNLELYQELVMDRMDWWKPISQAVSQSVLKRQQQKEEEAKN